MAAREKCAPSNGSRGVEESEQGETSSVGACGFVTWFIVNPVSGGGRGAAMLSELRHTFSSAHAMYKNQNTPAQHVTPGAAAAEVEDTTSHTVYDVHQYTANALLHTSINAQIASVVPATTSDRRITVFLVSTESAGEGLRVSEKIARAIAEQKLTASLPSSSSASAVCARRAAAACVHIMVPIGGDGTLSEVVNGCCRGVIAAYHVHQQQLQRQEMQPHAHSGAGSALASLPSAAPTSGPDPSAKPTSRSYYFRVLEEKSALRYLAPAFLYMPTGTGADFAKLKLCCASVEACTAGLRHLLNTLLQDSTVIRESHLRPSASTVSHQQQQHKEEQKEEEKVSVSVSRHAVSSAFACYETDVGRLTFPRTGRVHFYMNECSFGMSCDVIERAERLRGTRWMAPLGGTVLFATASLLSLLFWKPKAVRVMRLPEMPTLPSWGEQTQPVQRTGQDTEAAASRPTGETNHAHACQRIGHRRARAAARLPLHLRDRRYAQRALALDHACCESLKASLPSSEGEASHLNPFTTSQHQVLSDMTTSAQADLLAAKAAADSIAAHDEAFRCDQHALTELNYYCVTAPVTMADGGSPAGPVFKDGDSASSSANHSFSTHASTRVVSERETSGVSSGTLRSSAAAARAEEEEEESVSGLPLIGTQNPLFFRDAGAPQPLTTPGGSPLLPRGGYALASKADVHFFAEAKDVQHALDLPGPVLADTDTYSSSPGATTALAQPWSHVRDQEHAQMKRPSWVSFLSSTISFGIGRWFGGGLHITPHADPADGLLSVTSWRAEIIPFVARALSLYNGQHVYWRTTAAFDGARFVLDAEPAPPSDSTTQENTKDTPQLWVEADGEMVEPLPAVIELAGVLTFLITQPAPAPAPESPWTRLPADLFLTEANGATVDNAEMESASCQPLRFGPPAVGSTRAADWDAYRMHHHHLGAQNSQVRHPDGVSGLPARDLTEHAVRDATEAFKADMSVASWPEYMHLYATEWQRWPPAEEAGFFSTMAKSAPQWRVCCGALHRAWQLAQATESYVAMRCLYWSRQLHTWWCRGGRREREEDAEGQLQDSRHSRRLRALGFGSSSSRMDVLV